MSAYLKNYEKLFFDFPAPRVLRITMGDPEKLTTVCGRTHLELVNIWRDIEDDEEISAVILTGGTWLGGFDFVWPFTLPYLVLYFAHRLPFERVEQWGDYSYGIYIYAFPIQQCLVLGGLHHLGFLPYFGVSVFLAVLAGMASWFALERPVLNWTHTLSKRFRPAKRPTEVASQLELLTEKS